MNAQLTRMPAGTPRSWLQNDPLGQLRMSLSQGMSSLVLLRGLTHRGLHVDLGGIEVLMSHEFFEGKQIHAVVVEMGGEGVP